MRRRSGGWRRGAMLLAGAGAVTGALATLRAARRWREATEAMLAELERAAADPDGRVAFDRPASLPAPVQRYFRRVLRDGQPLIRSARVTQAGAFRIRESADVEAGWAPFTAVQRFTADPPGFVWDARIRMAPLLRVWVRDGYVAGRASMRGAAAGLVTVVDAPDDSGLRAGALVRWLAEAVWLPTALLPGAAVGWQAMDDRRARVTVRDGPTSASLEFTFGEDGEIVAAYTPARPREPGAGGEYVTAPWGGRYGGYREHAGMLVPTEAEVYWITEGREQPYYRGRNETLEYVLGGEREST